MKNEKGFSLIELIITIMVIGILAGIVIPQFKSFSVRSMDAAALSDLKQMMMSQDQFWQETIKYAGIDVADKSGSSVTVDVSGDTFSTSSLSENVEIRCVTSADGSSLIIAAKHTGSTTIVAADLDASGMIRKLEDQISLADAIIPTSTLADDLTVWSKF